jgi:uncharacterized protein YceK
MKKLILGALACALPSGCAGMAVKIGPRPGESPCAYGRRVMDEAQRRLDQARGAADMACSIASVARQP